MIRTFSLHSAAALALAAALATAPAAAQDTAPIQREDGEITTSQEIVVLGSVGYRNRSDEAEPVLSYDSEFFQRFEPLTAGDALKRVPSVTFLSDVIESDGARLRGLPPGYTQILINGERVPGNNDDRSFFMDRIPAELIDRVEIVRSSSARRTGDAIAGTINIQLRNGYELDGGYVRAGGLYYDDKELEPSFGAVYGGAVGPGRLLVGVNVQGRHNPKKKYSVRFANEEDDNDDPTNVPEFDNREDQSDVRDGKDYSANATYEIDGETTDFRISGFYVRTDRTETERSFEYEDETAITGPVPIGALTSDNSNINNIDQENYSIDGKLSHRWSLGETTLRVGFARFDDKQRESENQISFEEDEAPVLEQAFTATDKTDKEFSVKLDHEIELGSDIQLVFGGLYQDKKRDTAILDVDDESAGPTSYDQFVDNPDDLGDPLDLADLEPTDGGVNRIKERRLDGFMLLQGKSGGLTWEAGLRYETTKLDITDFTEAAEVPTQSNKYEKLLPSASIKFDLTSRDRITASVARTNRRPEFNYISPAKLDEEVADNDLLGNPQLDPETAWGVDVGYERRIGNRGIVGINAFYRDVKDLIELTNTGEEGSEGEGTFVYQPQNVGNGKVWGIEFDMSTDLGFVGLPNTGIFGNVSWLDSEISDFAGKRRFNGQSDYVYNVGFIQDLPKWGVAFGATHRKQGGAFDRVIGEEITTTYGGDLEIFVEKRFGKSFTIRAVGSNLLNGAKREAFNKYDNLNDQLGLDEDGVPNTIGPVFDEIEFESEKAGPVFQLIARYAF